MAPEQRVREFLRQWTLCLDKGDEIYGVAIDGPVAILSASDLDDVLGALDRVRALCADPAIRSLADTLLAVTYALRDTEAALDRVRALCSQNGAIGGQS